jgi:hypothetical protein
MLKKINHKEEVKVGILAIASSKYKPKEETENKFDKIIRWKQLHELYHKDIFKRADEIYGK